MILERFVNGRARSNAYIYADGDACVVIDPGVGAAPRIEQRLGVLGLRPSVVLLTHGHPDHVWTSRALAERYDVPVFLHRQDWRWLDDPACGGYVPLVSIGGRVVSRLRRIRPGRLEAADETIEPNIRVLHTPGHTAGSVCFLAGDVCFVGDTVFAAGLGHTFYPGGRRGDLVESVRRELSPLGDDVRLWPGHGEATTIGRVRKWIS